MSKTVLAFAARHGNTILNSQGKFRGLADPPLNADGKADAEELAKFFAPLELSAIFYSAKLRSQQTAQTIARGKDVPMYGTDSLYPWNVGMFSGQPKSPENVDKLEYYVQNPDIPIPNGESLQAFKNRIRPSLIEGMEFANKAGAPVLFVVHSSVIHEIGSMLSNDHNATLVEPGGVARIYTDGRTVSSEPIIKPVAKPTKPRADTIS
jgi:broad specificity phosphatase PhoE